MVRYNNPNISKSNNEIVSSAASIARLEARVPIKYRLGARESSKNAFAKWVASTVIQRGKRIKSPALVALGEEIRSFI